MNAFDADAATLPYAEHAPAFDVGAGAGVGWPTGAARSALDLRALRGLLQRARVGFVEAASASHPEWSRFLDSLTEAPVGLTPDHAQAVRQVWAELEVGVGPALPLPAVGPDGDGAVTLTWSTERFVAEVTVHPDGRHEWFFRDHDSGAFDGTDAPVRGGPSHRFHRMLAGVLVA